MNSQNNNKFKNKLFTSKVIDLSYLNKTLSGDKEMLKQMIQLFLAQSPEKIELLKKSVLEKNFNTIKETSHFLKSTFDIMGLQSKEDLIKIEQLSTEQKDYNIIVSLSEKIVHNFNDSVIEYKKIISTLK